MGNQSDPASWEEALDGQPGQPYGEDAFRYFLTVERKRAERSRRPCLLMLVHLKKQPGTSARIEQPVAARLFSGLALALRETDFIGWYREAQVIGAILSRRAGQPGADGSWITGRITGSLRQGLPPHVADRVQVRLHQLCPAPRR